MEHHKPHPGAAFEGYYSKFRLPSGGSLAIIVCAIHEAKHTPYMLSITYVSKDSKRHWQREYWPDSVSYVVTGPRSFEMRVAGHGSVRCSDDGDFYDIQTDDFRLSGRTLPETRQPWSVQDPEANPAGLLVYAPLPIQWHVQTLSSAVDFELYLVARPGELSLDPRDAQGRAHVHAEKNWAKTFPDRYIWVQAWDDDRRRGLTIAGGEALPGVQAFMLTYTDRSEERGARETVTMGPPFTFSLLGLSPFCSKEISYARRSLTLDVSDLSRRIRVESRAPADTFFQLSAPLRDGHSANFAVESFAATHSVRVWRRRWPWSSWKLTHEDTFEDGSLEYGGTYYDDRGTKKQA